MGKLDHLALYLTDSCNLACSYCYVAVNQAPASRLSLEQIRAAVDEFCGRVPPGRRKITFLGGEPLLDWGLFTAAARYARSAAGERAVLQTFTNGTLLTPEKAAFLRELGVHCTISLDGGKTENDRHRVYHRTKDRSVHDDAMARLAPLDKTNLGVSLVITPDTVERLLPSVEAFRAMGFGRITFNPELYGEWPPAKIAILRRSLTGLARWYRALLDAGVRPPQLQILYAVLESRAANARRERWWHECHNMTLGPDGHWYSCDKALSFPVGSAKDLRSGSAAAGTDWAAREEHLGEHAAWIEAQGGGDAEVFCPIGVVAHARHAGRDPRAALEGFRRVADEFAAGLMELVESCESHPAFQEMYVGEHVV